MSELDRMTGGLESCLADAADVVNKALKEQEVLTERYGGDDDEGGERESGEREGGEISECDVERKDERRETKIDEVRLPID